MSVALSRLQLQYRARQGSCKPLYLIGVAVIATALVRVSQGECRGSGLRGTPIVPSKVPRHIPPKVPRHIPVRGTEGGGGYILY